MKLALFALLLVVGRFWLTSAADDDFWDMVEKLSDGGTLEIEEEEEGSPSALTEEEFREGYTVRDTEPDLDPTDQDGGKFEGDIHGTTFEDVDKYVKDVKQIQRDLESLASGHRDLSSLNFDPDTNNVWRNAIADRNGLWPNARIPYVISSSFTSQERKVIAAAMNEFHTHTCIRFVGRDTESSYLYLKKLGGCWSYVGKTSSYYQPQEVSLGNGCVHKGIIIHELMHASGFWHEQSRTDRNNYVNIYKNNIQSGREGNFKSYGTDVITALNTRYDYGSIMHYGKYAFSRNGRATIEAKNGARIGQRSGLSSTDKLKLNRLYECGGQTSCKNKRSWCSYSWLRPYCNSCHWIQRYCPKMCGSC